MTRSIYFFGGGKADGTGDMKDILGGKGAGLAEMTNAGLPVPPGFTIATFVCMHYYENGQKTAERRPGDEEASLSSRSRRARSSATRRTRCSSPCDRARRSRCPA